VSDAKHTPGPWFVRLSTDGRPFAIDAPYDMHTPGGVGSIVRSRGIGLPSSPVAMANARLIAAAPDMFASLEKIRALLSYAEQDGVSPGAAQSNLNSAWWQARNALAKAGGSTS
jgi:hypothetical protein